MSKIGELRAQLAALEAEEIEATERPVNDPELKAAAAQIAKEYKGLHPGEPLAWRIQEDGTLTVVLKTGPKINAPIPPKSVMRKIAEAVKGEIDSTDGISQAEGSLAGKALQQAGKGKPAGGKK